MKLTLRTVCKDDYPFLYDLLKERPEYENISHHSDKMPSYAEHVKFMDNHPYKKDFIVLESGRSIGRVYLTDRNEVGIHFINGYLPLAEVINLMVKETGKENLFFNVSPGNVPLMVVLGREFNTQLIQLTYAYIP